MLILILLAVIIVFVILSGRNEYAVPVILNSGHEKIVILKAFSLNGANSKMADTFNVLVFVSDKYEIIPRESISSWGRAVEYKKK